MWSPKIDLKYLKGKNLQLMSESVSDSCLLNSTHGYIVVNPSATDSGSIAIGTPLAVQSGFYSATYLPPKPPAPECKCGRTYTILVIHKNREDDVFFCWRCSEDRIEKLEKKIENLHSLIGNLLNGHPSTPSC